MYHLDPLQLTVTNCASSVSQQQILFLTYSHAAPLHLNSVPTKNNTGLSRTCTLAWRCVMFWVFTSKSAEMSSEFCRCRFGVGLSFDPFSRLGVRITTVAPPPDHHRADSGSKWHLRKTAALVYGYWFHSCTVGVGAYASSNFTHVSGLNILTAWVFLYLWQHFGKK